MALSVTSAPFSRAVVSAMRKLYPESLAEKSWDNTGLLLEAPFDPLRRQMNSVLLTVDLTKAVVDEAIERSDSVIIAYHPIIFRGLKSITLDNTQQQSLLRLAAEGISVYSPHTALDCAPGGLGDWLADIVTGALVVAPDLDDAEGLDASLASLTTGSDPVVDKRPAYMVQHYSKPGKDLQLAATEHTRSVIKPVDHPDFPGAGMGRIVRFAEPQSLSALIDRISCGVGSPKGFPIAIPQGSSVDGISVRSVGICAGSGGGLLADLRDVDLLFTGELSHHEALAAIERGQCVITLFHSNTERGFLHSVLRTQLLGKVREEWALLRAEEREKEGGKEMSEALEDEYVSVEVSERDRDPYGLAIA
ncbi:NGG1p interacting factor 3 [Trichodelitschia bisporula]|uniref:NGG1p interacting factor 3 n=1 Tax=Trichodelitschia bisporula TaxID=703511 RepID=A0A6G1I2I1_9PEZI|nr:NGG1p interacting factor 3 [Trichodelitschia bisporula]